MLYLLKIWKDFTEWFTLLCGQTSSVYRKLTALSSADSWTHAKPTWMLLWIIILLLLLCWTNKDFILFIPLNVFNDIALCFFFLFFFFNFTILLQEKDIHRMTYNRQTYYYNECTTKMTKKRHKTAFTHTFTRFFFCFFFSISKFYCKKKIYIG